MKKIILISIISLLTLLSIISIYFSVKYYRQVKSLSNVNVENSSQIEKLTSELEDLKKTNETLKNSLTIEQSIFYKTQECMKKENYTTAGMSSCVYDSVDDWEKEINKHLRDLKKITTKEQYALVQKAQKDWEMYRKSQSIANTELLLSKKGTMYINIHTGMNVDIYEDRAEELDSLYYFFSQP